MISSSNTYLRYRGNSGLLSVWNAFIVGISAAFIEVYLREFPLGRGEPCPGGNFDSLPFPEMLCGVYETPWSNFSDVLLILTFLAAAVIGVFAAGGSSPNAKNDNSARGRVSGATRVDLADKAIGWCTLFVAAYLWRTLILTFAKILVAVFLSKESAREQVPDLIIFGALGVGILGCWWINRVLIPGLHVLRLDLEEMERRKWRLAMLEAELKKTPELDCGVGKHVVPLAGEHPHLVWIIRWLPMVRVLLSVLFLAALSWMSQIYLQGQDKEKTAWMIANAAVGFVALSEFAAVLMDNDRRIKRCIKCFVEGSRISFWEKFISGQLFKLLVIILGGWMSCSIIWHGDHKTLSLGILSMVFVILHVVVSFVAAVPGMHRKEGVWDASRWTELKEWKERNLGCVSSEQARCALVLQDYMRAEARERFKWLRSLIAWVRKSQGPAGKAMESMKNQIEKDCVLLADAIEDMGGRKSPIQ